MKKLLTLALMVSGFSASAQLQNGGMETWVTYTADTASLERPTSWFGSDSLVYGLASTFFFSPSQQVFEDGSHVHSGSAAARLVSMDIGGIVGVAPAILTNGSIAVDIANQTFSYSGGTPVTQRITFVNAWIDYQPQGTDEGLVQVQAVLAGQGQGGADSVVGYGEFFTDGTSGYEAVGISVDYIDGTVVPDRILIGFWSSSDLGTGTEGSTMWVDDVTMSTVSVNNTSAKEQVVKCYPNPTTGALNLFSTVKGNMTFSVYNTTGQLVHSQSFNGSGKADLANLANGAYFYTISDASGTAIQHDRLNISK